MRSAFLWRAVCISVFIISLLCFIQAVATAASFDSQLNIVIEDVRNAESSGANTNEMHMMINQLNTVLNLQNQIESLSDQDSASKTRLLGQISTNLNSIDAQAKQISTIAAQRTYTAHVATYATALVGALVATILYHYCLLFWRKSRMRRTFRMTLAPK